MNDTTHNHWQQDGEHAFSLFLGGERRATVDVACNRAVLLGGENRPEEKITAPDSKVIFDVVEDRLGLPRVRTVKYFPGHDDVSRRRLAEWNAEAFRKSHPKDTLPRFYLEHAWAVLREKSRFGLTEKGFEARGHLCGAWEALRRSDGRWTKGIHARVTAAAACLEQAAQQPKTMFEPLALLDCEKALASAPPGIAEEKKRDLGDSIASRSSDRKWNGPNRNGRGW
jgi:hypothetical protein